MKKKSTITKFFIIALIILIVVILYILLTNNNDEIIINKTNYLKGVEYSDITNNNLEEDTNNIIKSIDEYNKLINDNDLIIDNINLNFKDNNYLYYVISLNSCGEEIIGVNKVDIESNTARILFDIKRNCGVCPPQKYIYFIPINKEINIINIEADYNTINTPNCKSDVAYKPILYLYPEKDIDISVKIEHEEKILTSYPKYNNGWNIHVLKDGSMYDKDNKYYYALYWDELLLHKVDFKEGFYVDKDNAISFLEEKLSIIGLNPKEKNEFIMYWLPKLEDNQKNIVYFELTNEIENYNKLIINPKPNSLLRVRIHIKKINKKINIKEQKLETFKRTGFTAIEWGGTIYE